MLKNLLKYLLIHSKLTECIHHIILTGKLLLNSFEIYPLYFYKNIFTYYSTIQKTTQNIHTYIIR